MHRVFGTRIEHADYYHRPGAYVIPYRDGKIAAAKIPKGYFLLGGGKETVPGKASDALENDRDCILRECLEEIGWSVKVGQRICSAETYCEIPELGYYHPIQTYYECDLLERVQEPVETDHQLVWLTPEEAACGMYQEQQRWAVEMYMKRLRSESEPLPQNLTKLEFTNCAAHLFRGWQETIIWSCVQGVMGCVYADRQDVPASAAAVLGDFCFLAGQPSPAFLSALSKGVRQDFLIMVPADGCWSNAIEETFGKNTKKVTRYATKKGAGFDRNRLRPMAENIPQGLTLRRLDREVFDLAMERPWCRDWVSQYGTYEAYRDKGIGVVLMQDGEPVSGASSYSSYDGGIEIEIDTREDCRRQGLARICGAALILRCLDKGLYPSWDAHNKGSLALAEQLGYIFDHAYAAYETILTESR